MSKRKKIKTKTQLIDEIARLRVENQRLRIAATFSINDESAMESGILQTRYCFEYSNDAIFIHMVSGEILEVNSRACEMLGYDKSELLRMSVQELHSLNEREVSEKAFQEIKILGCIRFESTFQTKSGQSIKVEISSRNVDLEENIIIGIVRDISEQHRAQRALRHSEEKYRTLVTAIPDIMYQIDADGRFTFINDSVRVLGYEPEELIGRHFSVLIHSNDIERVSRSFVLPIYARKITGDENSPKLFDERRSGKRGTKGLEVRLVPKRNQDDAADCVKHVGLIIIYGEVSASGDYESNGTRKFIGTVGLIHDITERKLADVELRRQQRELKTIFDSVPSAIWYKDRHNRIIRVNKAGAAMFGLAVEGIEGKLATELFPEADAAQYYEDDLEVMASGISKLNIVEEMQIFSGERRWVSVDKVPYLNEDGNVIGIIAFIRDITDQMQAERALRYSEEKFRTVVNASKDAIVAIGSDGNILLFNPAAEQMFGYTEKEVDCKPLDGLLPENLRLQHRKSVQGFFLMRSPSVVIGQTLELKAVRRTGEEFPVELSLSEGQSGGKKIVFASIRDITIRKRMEDEAIKSQRMESIGLLAGGIAHDFNNILTVIIANLSLAEMESADGNDIRGLLTDAQGAASRAHDLTKQLLTFSKGGAPITESASIEELIETTVKFALRGSNVCFGFDFGNNVRPVEIDVGQISQVIQNIVINAKQSMPAGGKIHVRAGNYKVGKKSKINMPVGEYVRVVIKDQGGGIPAKYLNRVFDLYFTTKQTGSGLGLATAYFIIHKHKGKISITSKVNVGTIVSLYLPVSAQEIESKKVVLKETNVRMNTVKILVMDDDVAVQTISRRLIEKLGHQVDIAKDGETAISMYETSVKDDDPYDLLIMDLTVPGGMGGAEAIKILKGKYPDIKAIVSSGYSENEVMSNRTEHGFCAALAKPYNVTKLRALLIKVLR